MGKLCDWALSEGGRLVFTSIWRPHGRRSSKHYSGNAGDFYREYTGLVGTCEVLRDYKHQVTSLQEWLRLGGSENKHGMGIYPHKLIIHLDVRAARGRWAFDIDDNEITFEEGMEELEVLIDNTCE